MIWLTNWRILTALALAAVLAGALAYANHEHNAASKAKAELKEARAELRTCHANTGLLESAIKRQNAAADALKAEADHRAKVLADGLQAARKSASAATAEAQRIAAIQPKGADQCARLMDLDAELNR